MIRDILVVIDAATERAGPLRAFSRDAAQCLPNSCFGDRGWPIRAPRLLRVAIRHDRRRATGCDRSLLRHGRMAKPEPVSYTACCVKPRANSRQYPDLFPPKQRARYATLPEQAFAEAEPLLVPGVT